MALITVSLSPVRSMSEHELVDALGIRHVPTAGRPRIVSLVPSLTELLFALDLSDYLVGRTHYCIHPAGAVERVPSVGGTKKVKRRLVRELAPTHAILNIDENTRAMAEQLGEFVPHLIVTHPLSPQDNPALYRLIGGIFDRSARAEVLCRRFEAESARLRTAAGHWLRRQVLYLIWRRPWMTVARDTYIARTLAQVGWDTLPAVSDQRYPAIDMPALLAERPDLVLFSSEPYSFDTRDLETFAADYGYPLSRLALIDAEMVSWYGSRAIAGLDYLYHFALAHRPGG